MSMNIWVHERKKEDLFRLQILTLNILLKHFGERVFGRCNVELRERNLQSSTNIVMNNTDEASSLTTIYQAFPNFYA